MSCWAGNILSAGGNKWIVYSATFWLFRGIFGHRPLLFPRSHYNGTISCDLVNLVSTGGQQKNCSLGDILSFLLHSPARVTRLVNTTRLCVYRLLRCFTKLNRLKVGLPKVAFVCFSISARELPLPYKYGSYFDLIPQ